jgi:small-conductance mechanosensitive channel
MKDQLMQPLESLPAWLTDPLFSIGQTPVSLARLLALAIIVVMAWWLASQLERGMRRLSDRLADPDEPGSAAGVYAFSRVARYLVWVLATVIGLTWLGFDLTSLAILGGAIGVGLGIGLQGFFGNLFSGLVILFERSAR